MSKEIVKYLVLDGYEDGIGNEHPATVLCSFEKESEILNLAEILYKVLKIDEWTVLRVYVYNEKQDDSDIIKYGRQIAFYDSTRKKFVMSDCLNI